MQHLQNKAVKMLLLKPRATSKSVNIMYKDNKKMRVRKNNTSCNDFEPERKRNFKISKSSSIFEETKKTSILEKTRELIKNQKKEKLKSLKLQFDLE